VSVNLQNTNGFTWSVRTGEKWSKGTFFPLEPTNSFYEEDLEDVTMILEDIIPDISISPFIPNFGYVEYE
jgi:hypothetical protein